MASSYVRFVGRCIAKYTYLIYGSNSAVGIRALGYYLVLQLGFAFLVDAGLLLQRLEHLWPRVGQTKAATPLKEGLSYTV